MMYGTGYNGFVSCFGNGPGSMFYGGGIIMMVGIVILAAIIIGLIFKKRSGGRAELDLLKMRYVNGEISEDEYLRSLNVLNR